MALLPRVHGNIKRIPQWKTKMVIDKSVAEIVKNQIQNCKNEHCWIHIAHFELYANIHHIIQILLNLEKTCMLRNAWNTFAVLPEAKDPAKMGQQWIFGFTHLWWQAICYRIEGGFNIWKWSI